MTLTSTDLLRQLVAFDTTSARTNLPLVHWVAQYLRDHGVESHLTHDATGMKANLFASIGPRDEGGVCLHGHTDVVPVAGQPWTSDPFTLAERAGRLHGRGTCDMKAWLACALAAVPALTRRRLRTPVHLALSFDEEVGCFGTPHLLASFGRAVPRPLAVIVGEPSLLRPIVAHKGVVALETTITGQDAHSSLLHLGLNAATAAAEMAVELHRIAGEWRDLPGPAGMQPSGPTINVGVLRGGIARNVIPREAQLQWELRFRLQDAPRQLLEDVAARVQLRLRRSFGADFARLAIRTSELAQIPAFDAGDDDLAVRLVRQLGAAGEPQAVPYGAEAGQYAEAGVPAVICGPGSIAQAHQPDEYVECSQLQACDALLDRLAHWAGEVRLADAAAVA